MLTNTALYDAHCFLLDTSILPRDFVLAWLLAVLACGALICRGSQLQATGWCHFRTASSWHE